MQLRECLRHNMDNFQPNCNNILIPKEQENMLSGSSNYFAVNKANPWTYVIPAMKYPKVN